MTGLGEVNRIEEAIRAGFETGSSLGRLETPTAEPLFDLHEARFDRFLLEPPPPREYILRNVLPTNIVGLLASMGGAGKSFLAFQLALSVVTGVPFLGLPVDATGSVLCLFAEDDEAELHRRGHTLLDRYAIHDGARRKVAEELFIVSRVGKDNRLTTATGEGDVVRTPILPRLIEAVRTIPNLRLIIIDPVSRFRGGNANNEEHATRFVEVLEEIRSETGATILGLHHMSQAGIRAGGGQEIVRGSTALVDGVRWVATLQPPRGEQARKFGGSDARQYLRLEVPKSNYARPFDGMWLRREASGVIVRATLQGDPSARKAEREYEAILGRLRRLLGREDPLTRNQIRNHSGLNGPLGASDQTVRDVIKQALRVRDLRIDDDGTVHSVERTSDTSNRVG